MATFTAQWSQECAECPGTVRKGDEAMYNLDNEVCHAPFCPAENHAPARPTCPRCWLELPATGVCGNCDG